MVHGFNHAFSKNMTDRNVKIASLLLQYTIYALFTSKNMHFLCCARFSPEIIFYTVTN